MVWTLSIFLVAIQLVVCGLGADPVYTRREHAALAKFRPLVNHTLYKDYMHADHYLIKWLRVQHFDLHKAKEMLEAAHKWRKKDRIDTILQENFSYFDKRYVFNIDAVDNEGRPVFIATAGSWRPRQAILGGQLAKYNRFFMRTMLEVPDSKMRNLTEATGKVITQYILIFDIQGMNVRDHLCLRCMETYTNLAITSEAYYPMLANKVFLINCPDVLDNAIELIRPVLRPETRKILLVYGQDKRKWQADLLKYIPASQLPPAYGGTKIIKQNDFNFKPGS